jgi:predicted MFS family arabinose efflux permease
VSGDGTEATPTSDAEAGETAVGAPAIASERTRWVLLAGAVLMSTSLAAYELAPASVTPLVRDSLGVSAPTAGLLVSVMFGTAVVGSLPAGVLLDRTNSRHVVAVAIGLLVVAGAWGWVAASAGHFASLLASRALGGLAFVVVWNASIDVVARSFPARRRATAVGIFTASGPVGFAVGQAGAPVVANAYGWPAVFPAFSVVAVGGLALFWPASRGSGRATGTATPTVGDLRRVVTDVRVGLVGLLAFLAYALYLFVNSWVPSYLTEVVGLRLALAGLLAALFPAVGVLGRVTGGVLSDRLFDGRRRPVVLLSFVVTTPVVALFTGLQGTAVLVAALLVAGLAIQLSLGLVFAYVRELVEPGVAATAVAYLTAVGLGGAFVAPIAAGAIIEVAGYGTAFAAAGVVGVLGVVLSWAAPEP